MVGLPKGQELAPIFADKSLCIEYLISKGVLTVPESCESCGGQVALYGHQWRCKRTLCRKKGSILTGTFFANSRLPVNEIMELGYYWLAGACHQFLMTVTGHSPNTITDYIKFYQELVYATFDDEDTMIGGPGIKVQVDESKYGKVKYHKGYKVEGVWIIGGVEETYDRRMFLEHVETRDRATILDVLARHIRPGSILVTDCWRGYTGIAEHLQVSHITVNHSETFKDEVTGVCTNHIEGTWAAI